MVKTTSVDVDVDWCDKGPTSIGDPQKVIRFVVG